MAVFTPRPYQWMIHDFIVNNPRGNVFSSMGTGKTGSTLMAYQTLRMFGESKRALVFAPRRVALTTWPDEVRKFKESFGDISIVAAVGTPEQRIEALKREADVTCINYEQADWLTETLGDHWPFDTVFADESVRLAGLRISLQRRKKSDGTYGEEFLQGQGAKRAKTLAKIAHKKVRRWINETGSPAPNGMISTWGPQWFVDGGQRLGNSFTSFSHRWFRSVPGSDPRNMQIEPMPFAQQEIEQLMRTCSITINAKDWFDIKEPIERKVYVDLPPRARKQYQEMQKELFTWIDEHPVEAFNAGAKAQKCLQLASGSVIVDTKTSAWLPVHDEKIEALKSIVAETNGEPLLIAYQFKADKDRILKAFPRFKTLDHKGAQKDFEEGRLPGLVVHPASAGHGLNLQKNCRIMVDYSSGFNLEFDEQVIERVGPTRQMQIGKDVAVFRYRIVARDTIEDTVVLPRLKSKASVQDAFKAAMRVNTR